MLEYQKGQLNAAMRELGTSSFLEENFQQKSITKQHSTKESESIKEYTKNTIIEELEKKLMNIRSMDS